MPNFRIRNARPDAYHFIGNLLQAASARSQYISTPRITRVKLFSRKLARSIQDQFKPATGRRQLLRKVAAVKTLQYAFQPALGQLAHMSRHDKYHRDRHKAFKLWKKGARRRQNRRKRKSPPFYRRKRRQ